MSPSPPRFKFTEAGCFTQLIFDGHPVLERGKTILAIIKDSKNRRFSCDSGRIPLFVLRIASAQSSLFSNL
jgi:hypothetical protein